MGERYGWFASARSPVRIAIFAALVAGVLGVAGVARAAEQVTLAPIPGTTNATYLVFDYAGFDIPVAGPNLEVASRIEVAYDPTIDASLRFTMVSLKPSYLGGCLGPHVCTDTCNEEMTLAAGAPPQQTTVQPDGSFQIELSLELHYGAAPLGGCSGAGNLQTATASLTGHFEFQDTPRVVELTNVTGPIVFTSGTHFIDGTLALNFEGGFRIDPLGGGLHVGSAITLTGVYITPGSVLKLFVATSTGSVDVMPNGLVPTSTTVGSWSGTLPWPWPVGGANAKQIGNGYCAGVLVRTDMGFDQSPVQGFLLRGNAALGVPSIDGIDAFGYAPSSTDPSYAAANIEHVIVPGDFVGIQGAGFVNPLVNVFTAAGNLGPITPNFFNPGAAQITLPPSAPIGPGSIQVVSQNAGGNEASEAVSIVLGEQIGVTTTQLAGGAVSVVGTGFGSLTVVNFFAFSGGNLVNAGGLFPNGAPKIPLDVSDAHHFSFTLPGGLDAGPAYVEALNPPFVPFTRSSGDGGNLVLP